MFEGISLFSTLNTEELKTLELFCQERELEAGEILFHEGEDANSMYILKSGALEVYNDEKIFGIIEAGEFVGEMSIFEGNKKRTASVKALKDSRLITLVAFSIENLSKNHPEIMIKIKDVIMRRKMENENR